MGFVGLHFAIFEFYTVKQGPDVSWRQLAFNFGNIGFGYTKFWVRKFVCQFTVVGEQKQSGCLCIKATNIENAILTKSELAQIWATKLVSHRTDNTIGFVERDINPRGIELNRGAANTNLVDLWVDSRAKLFDNLAVYFDSPGRNQIFTCTSRSNTGVSQNLLQSNAILLRFGHVICSLSQLGYSGLAGMG